VTDIVERLHDYKQDCGYSSHLNPDGPEAADEIIRLRDALKIAREALKRIEAATRNEVRAGDKGYVSRYGIHGIARAALDRSQ
jgi:hypothetical protein